MDLSNPYSFYWLDRYDFFRLHVSQLHILKLRVSYTCQCMLAHLIRWLNMHIFGILQKLYGVFLTEWMLGWHLNASLWKHVLLAAGSLKKRNKWKLNLHGYYAVMMLYNCRLIKLLWKVQMQISRYKIRLENRFVKSKTYNVAEPTAAPTVVETIGVALTNVFPSPDKVSCLNYIIIINMYNFLSACFGRSQ